MLTKEQEQYRKLVLNPISFKAGLFAKLPLAGVADCRMTELTETTCKITVPYRFLNKNPFDTTYWAVLGMAAEMAGGALLLMYIHKSNPSISTFVTGLSSKFIKTATGLTTFVCEEGEMIRERVQKAIQTGEPDAFNVKSIGYDKYGNITSEFTFEWSIKARKKK